MGDAIDLAAVNEVLSTFKDPETGRNVVTTNQAQDIKLEGDSLQLKLGLTTHSAPLWEETCRQLEELLRERLPDSSTVPVRPNCDRSVVRSECNRLASRLIREVRS